MLFIIKVFFIFIFIFNSANAIEKKWFKKGEYSNWEVYVKSEKDICYAISKPQKMQGAYNLRGRVNVIVAINNNIKNKYYVGFDFGYSFADKDKVKLTIDDNVFLK